MSSERSLVSVLTVVALPTSQNAPFAALAPSLTSYVTRLTCRQRSEGSVELSDRSFEKKWRSREFVKRKLLL